MSKDGQGESIKRVMELLWGLAERPRKGPRPRTSVPEIVAAAVRAADGEGLEALSMRRVADDVGLSPMALYTYIPGKDELIQLMVDAVQGDAARSSGADGPPSGDWRARVTAIARRTRAMHLGHPWLAQVAPLSRPLLGPGTLALYEADLRAIDGIGLSDVQMDAVLTLLAEYVSGATRATLAQSEAERRSGLSDDAWWEISAPLLEKVFDAERYPVAARVGAAAGADLEAAYDPDRAFEFGLARLLDGIAALLPPAP
ncbi:MAG: TetR family transcriptional regulator [Streptosporangiales bacterium]|nr:TetR family transcriptional regulator [Streptosporangiales bacterium]